MSVQQVSFALLVCCVYAVYGASLSITADHTLSGKAVSGDAMKMTLKTDSEYLSVNFTAPYYDGSTNRVHLFLANQENRITELKFTLSDNVLQMYWAPYNVLRKITLDNEQASSSISSDKKTWTGTAKIHRDFLPPRITLYNAAAVHAASSSSSELEYDTLYSITNYGVALPDLMVLPRYIAVGAGFLFANHDKYSKEWKMDT